MSRYLIILERTKTGFSAYSPDLPGCVATGATREEVEREMQEAIEFHIEGLRLAGDPVPEPSVAGSVLGGRGLSIRCGEPARSEEQDTADLVPNLRPHCDASAFPR